MVTNKVKGINLLPNEYIVAQKVSFYQKIISIVVAVEVVGFIALVALPPKRQLIETQDELATLQNEVHSEKYAEVNKTLNDLETAKKDIQTWMNEYKGIKVKGFIQGTLLDELVSRMPAGMQISLLEINDVVDKAQNARTSTISITAQYQTIQAYAEYSSILEEKFGAGSVTSEMDESGKNNKLTVKVVQPVSESANAQDGQTDSTEGTDASESPSADSSTEATGEGAE